MYTEFKRSDERAKSTTDSMQRVILQVVQQFIQSSYTAASAIEQIRQIKGHLRHFVSAFGRSHLRAVAKLSEFERTIDNGPISMDNYQPFNEYLILRTTASIRSIRLLRALESSLRIMWQKPRARNILIPAFDEHPAQRVETYLRDLHGYLRAISTHASPGPYSSAEGVLQSARLFVARRTIGTMPDARITVSGFNFACTCIRFTQSAAELLDYPFVECILCDSALPTGSSCARGVVLKAQEDIGNEALWVVVDVSAGGSHVSLVLANTNAPSRLSRTSFVSVHVRDVAIRFLSVHYNDTALCHADLYALGIVAPDGGGYIRPDSVYVLASARERFPGFDEDLFRKHGLQGEPYTAPRASQAELSDIARVRHRLPRRGVSTFPFPGNHFVVTASSQARSGQTVDVYQGLGGDHYPIRASTLLEHYRRVGSIDQTIRNQGGQYILFDDADGALTRVMVAPGDAGELDPRDFYEWAGDVRKRAVGTASIHNMDLWPETTSVATATHRGEQHERKNIFHNAELSYPGKEQTVARVAAIIVCDDDLPTGLCLEDRPEVSATLLDLDEISLGVPVDLPWASGDGELDDLLDINDLF